MPKQATQGHSPTSGGLHSKGCSKSVQEAAIEELVTELTRLPWSLTAWLACVGPSHSIKTAQEHHISPTTLCRTCNTAQHI